MGSIRFRGKFWQLRYSRKGEPVEETTPFTLNQKSEAKRLLREREGDIATGRFYGLDVEKITFEKLAEGLIQDYESHGLKSLNRAERSVKQLSLFFSGHTVVEITGEAIKKYVAQRQSEKRENATINRELSALKRMFTLQQHLTPGLQRPYIPHYEENNVREGFFDPKDYTKLKDALPDYLRPVLTMGYLTGMRIGEILSLTWDKVNLVEGNITLERGLTKNKSPRKIPLLPEVYEVIYSQQILRDSKYSGCPFVFFHDGQQIKDFRTAWKTACKRTGLPGKLVHDLRRTAVRHMVRAGVSESVAMEISGHKTRSVFQRYNITDDRDLKAAAEKMTLFHQAEMKKLEKKS